MDTEITIMSNASMRALRHIVLRVSTIELV